MKEEIYIDTISGEKLIKEIWYYNNGNIQREYYYLNNNPITDDLQIMVMKGLNNI